MVTIYYSKKLYTVRDLYWSQRLFHVLAVSFNSFMLQWFSMKRQHALLVLADSLYYTKFKLYCKVYL